MFMYFITIIKLFKNYNMFQAGHIEDIVIDKDHRGKGHGHVVFPYFIYCEI